MKKKNLAILLIIPFLVSLFGIVTINAAFNLIENDVISINWNYRDNELFEVGKQFPLQAEGVVADKRYPASARNELIWDVNNLDDPNADKHAITVHDGRGNWSLKTISEGTVEIICYTEKGNVTPMKMTGIIYEGSAFVINTKINGSGQNVDSTIYFGEYDLINGEKQPAVIDFEITASSNDILSGLEVDTENTSSNLSVDTNGGKIIINGTQEENSYVTLKNNEFNLSTTFEFKVVEDGINVYNYQDLLYCTNRSESGEIAVLRKNFESTANYEASSSNNVALFGTADGFNFENEVYRFPTKYNSEYIEQWNSFVESNSSYSKINDEILAGLRIQKDFYGNGYTINLHNLCFPTGRFQVDGYDYYKPGDGDLYRGPKPFYLLGDPNNLPLVTAYGQDNTGIYIDGDNITVNDIKIKNCEFGLVLNSLDYVGTVVEVNGNGNTVKNSVMSNGKNIVRSFSSMDLTLDNCILSTCRNFLLMVGSNEYEKTALDDSTQRTFTTYNGTYNGTIFDYLTAGNEGDSVLNIFATGFAGLNDVLEGNSVYNNFSESKQKNEYKSKMKTALKALQSGLNQINSNNINDIIHGSTEICDTIFYRSGIASIGVETLFNGPFLYNSSPSMIQAILSLFGSMLETAIPMFPNNVSGSSYPVSLNLSGNTRFYDYKALQDWDISGLIDQNISSVINGLGLLSSQLEITIDDIFPLKQILTAEARKRNLIYNNGELDYINIPIAFYGGGKNLSIVTTNGLNKDAGGFTQAYDVDLLDSYLDMTTVLDLGELMNSGNLGSVVSDPNFMRFMKETLTKTVTTVTGFEAFKFSFGNSTKGLFDIETGTPLAPDFRDLIH